MQMPSSDMVAALTTAWQAYDIHNIRMCHFLNLINSFLVHNLPIPQISRKSTHHFLSCPVLLTDRQVAVKTETHKNWQT